MQISYLYALDFVARQTSRTITNSNLNWSKQVFGHNQVLFWLLREMHKLTGDTRVKSWLTFIRKARRNANDCEYN